MSEENTEDLVALQLNLDRGIAEIKLLATQPSKPLQPRKLPFIQHGMCHINSTLKKYVACHPKVFNQNTI